MEEPDPLVYRFLQGDSAESGVFPDGIGRELYTGTGNYDGSKPNLNLNLAEKKAPARIEKIGETHA